MNEPITPAQAGYIGRLIGRVGKPQYKAAKTRLDIPADVTIMQLSKNDAARLIRELIRVKNYPARYQAVTQ